MTRERYKELSDMNKKEFEAWAINKKNDTEYRDYIFLFTVMVDENEKTLNLSEYLTMTNDQVKDVISKKLKEIGGDWVHFNGRMSPLGSATCEALFELCQEKQLYEYVCECVDKVPGFHGRRDFDGIEETTRIYAECGCCLESGGHTSVVLKDGTWMEFDSYGSLIEKRGKFNPFRWLKL